MAQSNMNVDFIDNDENGELVQDSKKGKEEDKHKRAKIAHQLAVVLMFDQKAQHHKEQRKPVKRVKGQRGALEKD